MSLLTTLLSLLELPMLLSSAWLLVQLAAAASRRPAQPEFIPSSAPRLAILIPAHDESETIQETLAACRQLEYPSDHWQIIVLADNCTDQTAELARRAGAEVLERQDPARRGKGQALAWAIPRVLAQKPDLDGLVLLDADCQPSPNLLRVLGSRLAAGQEAVQSSYVVANPSASWSAALRYAAFGLVNLVRPLGRDALGLSCGLLGTGMAFSRRLLERQPWSAFSMTEDGEYHLRLVAVGRRVRFAPEARVESAMPITLRDADSQHERWESGKWQLARQWTPTLLRTGLARRDPRLPLAALELLLPPQALLLAGQLSVALVAVLLGGRQARNLAVAGLAAQAVFVLGGLKLARAPLAVYRALLAAPLLVLWKVGLHVRLLLGRGPVGWVRTSRAARSDTVPAAPLATRGGLISC